MNVGFYFWRCWLVMWMEADGGGWRRIGGGLERMQWHNDNGVMSPGRPFDQGTSDLTHEQLFALVKGQLRGQ